MLFILLSLGNEPNFFNILKFAYIVIILLLIFSSKFSYFSLFN